MSTVAVDPRIRARRVTVARDAGRRRLRRLLVLAGLLGIALLAFAATWTPALDVDRVEVQGAAQTAPDAIEAAAGVHRGDPLAWFDPDAAERAVAALPWIDEASISRSWSGEVRVAVTEREAVAALATAEDGWVLADGEGRALAAADAPPTDLALVDAVTTSAGPGEQLDVGVLDALAVAAAIPPSLRPDIAIVRGTGASLEAELREGGVIVLGGVDEAEAKMATAAAVLATVGPGCVDRLDVGLPAAPALIRVPGCA